MRKVVKKTINRISLIASLITIITLRMTTVLTTSLLSRIILAALIIIIIRRIIHFYTIDDRIQATRTIQGRCSLNEVVIREKGSRIGRIDNIGPSFEKIEIVVTKEVVFREPVPLD